MVLPDPSSPRRRSPFACMDVVDWALVGVLTTTLCVLCTFRSNTRLLWADELYGYRVVGASSVPQMLRGWWQGADGGGLFYYLAARGWVRLFGLSELTLRLFSTAGMSLALALTWTAARRYFSTFIVALSVGLVYLTPPAMLWQEVNGRFYGPFLAAAALASLWFLVTAEAVPTRGDLVVTAAAHAWLIGSHILGLVYSFSLIMGLVAHDYVKGRWRWRLYLAAATGWLMVPLSLHAIRASASIATTIFWTYKPRLPEIVLGWAVFGRLTLALLAVALLLAGGRAIFARQHTVPPILTTAVPFLVASLLLAQAILFGKSQFGLSIYSDRYLLPLSLVAVFLFGTLLTMALPTAFGRSFPPRTSLFAGLAVLVPCCAYAFARDPNYLLYPPRNFAHQMAASIPGGAPVLATLPVFTLMTHYDPTHTYLFSLNWHYDLAPGHPPLDYSGERLMENWKRAGYESDHILPCEQIFGQYPDLYLLMDMHRADWFRDRLEHNPAYLVQQIATVDPWKVPLWRVHRIGPGSLPC